MISYKLLLLQHQYSIKFSPQSAYYFHYVIKIIRNELLLCSLSRCKSITKNILNALPMLLAF